MLIPFAPTEAHSFCARCGFFFFFLLWTAGSGVGVFRSVVGKWACVCVCGSGLVLVVGFFFFFLLWTAGSGGGGGGVGGGCACG